MLKLLLLVLYSCFVKAAAQLDAICQDVRAVLELLG